MKQPQLVYAEALARQDVATFRPELGILEALALLQEHGVSGAPVTDAEGQLVGVFSDTDARRVLAQAAFYSVPVGVVGDHMTRDVVSVQAHADVFQVVDVMRKHHLHRLPVCDGRRLVGEIQSAEVDEALWQMVLERQARQIPKPPPGAAWDRRISAERDRRG